MMMHKPLNKIIIMLIFLALVVSITFFLYLRAKNEHTIAFLQGNSTGLVTHEDITKAGGKQLANPMAVITDPVDNNVYIADSSNGRVLVYNSKGKFTKQIGGSQGAVQFSYPVALAAWNKYLYVGDLSNSRVNVLTKDGKLLYQLPRAADQTKLSGFKPLALATAKNGDLYVADGASQKIVIFNQAGFVRKSFGYSDSGDRGFSFPNGLAVDDEKQSLYVADSNNARILDFTLEGDFKRVMAGLPKESGFMPRGLVLLPNNNLLLIVDTMGNRVLSYDLTKQQVAHTLKGFGETALYFPNGIAVDKDKTLYITNRGSNTVIKAYL